MGNSASHQMLLIRHLLEKATALTGLALWSARNGDPPLAVTPVRLAQACPSDAFVNSLPLEVSAQGLSDGTMTVWGVDDMNFKESTA